MTYPINPTDGQQTNVNGVIYTYSTAVGAWLVTSAGGSLLAATDISATGNVSAPTGTLTAGPMFGDSLTVTGNIQSAGITATDVTFNGEASVTGNVVIDGAQSVAGSITAAGFLTGDELVNTPVIPRVDSVASASTITINCDTTDQYFITNLATDTTIVEPTGTPVSGQKLTIRILDDGVARNVAWDPVFVEMGTALPIVTLPGKYAYVGCYWNSEEGTWDAVSVAQQV